MEPYVLIFVENIFPGNLALALFLGMCTFLACSKDVKTAFGLSMAVTVIQSITVPINNLIYQYLLRPGALSWTGSAELANQDLEFVGLICYIGVIAAMVQILEMALDKFFPALFNALGIFLPLITTNCAVLGVALLSARKQHTFLQAAVYGFGAAIGFTLVLVLFAAIRERTDHSDVPAPFRGHAIAMISAGIMSLAFIGFTGFDN